MSTSNTPEQLLNQKSQVIIQGMTGKEGQRALNWMLQTGITVVAGVTPGKGGQEVEAQGKVFPVYNSVSEALEAHPEVTMSSMYVPPKFVLGAAKEAIAAKNKTGKRLQAVHIFAEGVPSLDTCKILELGRQHGVRIVGPSSIGFCRTSIGSVGSMGGGSMDGYLSPANHPSKKGVAVISKSGGMANTIANVLTENNIAQTTIIGIGGDRLIGTTYADMLPELEADPETAAIVIVGEIGGAYEEMLAQKMTELGSTKPIIAFISGIFAETLPQGVAFGHAGAIVSKSEGTRAGKIEALSKAGAIIANSPTEIVSLIHQQSWYS